MKVMVILEGFVEKFLYEHQFLLLLGRIDGKLRQGGGRHISLTDSAALSLV